MQILTKRLNRKQYTSCIHSRLRCAISRILAWRNFFSVNDGLSLTSQTAKTHIQIVPKIVLSQSTKRVRRWQKQIKWRKVDKTTETSWKDKMTVGRKPRSPHTLKEDLTLEIRYAKTNNK